MELKSRMLGTLSIIILTQRFVVLLYDYYRNPKLTSISLNVNEPY